MEWRDFFRLIGYLLAGAIVNGIHDGLVGQRQFDYTSLLIVAMGVTILHAIRERRP